MVCAFHLETYVTHSGHNSKTQLPIFQLRIWTLSIYDNSLAPNKQFGYQKQDIKKVIYCQNLGISKSMSLVIGVQITAFRVRVAGQRLRASFPFTEIYTCGLWA